MTFYQNQLQSYSLSGAGVVSGATSMTLKSMKDIDGNALTMATAFGTEGFGTVEPGNNTLEESITFTGLTNNANGTTTLTGVSSVTFGEPYTQTSGFAKTHAGSTTFVVSNTSGFYTRFAVKENDETITGQWTFNNTPIVPGTVSDASTTVKGVTKLTVAPVSSSNPIAVGANDPKLPTADPTTLFAPKVSTQFGGTGADGALALTTGTTNIDVGAVAVYIKNYTSISITGTAKLTFSNPHANGTVVILKSQGNVTVTSSTVPAITVTGMGAAGGPGSASDNGTVGVSGSTVFGIAPVGGGAGPKSTAAGGTGGVGIAGAATSPVFNSAFGGTIRFIPFVIGAGGGGGGYGSNTGHGGDGGKGGGSLTIFCGGALNITSTLSAEGVVGNPGVNGGADNNGSGGGGGGGSGSIFVLYNSLTANSGTYTVSGGAGGAGGTGGANGTGGAGGGGSNSIGVAGSANSGGTGGVGGAGGVGISVVALNTELY